MELIERLRAVRALALRAGDYALAREVEANLERLGATWHDDTVEMLEPETTAKPRPRTRKK